MLVCCTSKTFIANKKIDINFGHTKYYMVTIYESVLDIYLLYLHLVHVNIFRIENKKNRNTIAMIIIIIIVSMKKNKTITY